MTTDVFIDTPTGSTTNDLFIDENGDLLNGDFFDSSLRYSLLGERRANASEVPVSHYRRGDIISEGEDYENGSKIWTYYQARLTRTVMNSIRAEALVALQWLIDDGYLKNIEIKTVLINNKVTLRINLIRFNSQVDRRFFELWENTGVLNAA